WTVLLHVYFSIDVRQKEEVYPLSWVRLLFLVLSFNLYMVKKKRASCLLTGGISGHGMCQPWDLEAFLSQSYTI
ncbi:hypothetical protein CBF69_09025, partial [Lactobacillus taiwanensis]|uniref:hypothetical protein n=1 Tax=Lactobacillus taiwanensis TaxID=508451 RepID=UPI000BD7A308